MPDSQHIVVFFGQYFDFGGALLFLFNQLEGRDERQKTFRKANDLKTTGKDIGAWEQKVPVRAREKFVLFLGGAKQS